MSAQAVIEAQRSGVYRTPANADVVRRRAAKARLVWIELPLRAVSSKKQFLEVCAKQLQLPPHFGGNWDALADCVRDVEWLRGAGHVLHVSDGEKFAKAAPDDYRTALAVLGEAAGYWKDKGTPFIVFVDGVMDLPAF